MTKSGDTQHSPAASSAAGGAVHLPSHPNSATPPQRPAQSVSASPVQRPWQSRTAPLSHSWSQPITPGPSQRRTCRAPQWFTRTSYPSPQRIEQSVQLPHSLARHFSPQRRRCTAGLSGLGRLPYSSGYVQKNTAGRHTVARWNRHRLSGMRTTGASSRPHSLSVGPMASPKDSWNVKAVSSAPSTTASLARVSRGSSPSHTKSHSGTSATTSGLSTVQVRNVQLTMPRHVNTAERFTLSHASGSISCCAT
mmetsp:Transcript_39139/g.96948  ORF Transcript_39139/g.96948 Transcript_39139/m.96948 type:complete len:251 (-) Transcript_39139:477-1229(-)